MSKAKTKTVKHRIPYETWMNSQLSIARHYGRVILNDDVYVLDFDNAPTKVVDGEVKYFPDLVCYGPAEKVKTTKKAAKKSGELYE